MKAKLKVLGLASAVFCLLMLFVATPSVAQCGPGGAGCQGCSGSCTGVACAIPFQHIPSPGTCTAAQLAAGATQLSTSVACAGSLAGVCQCYLPSFYQITQQNCARVYFTSLTGEESTILSSPSDCKAPEKLMTPAESPELVEAPEEIAKEVKAR